MGWKESLEQSVDQILETKFEEREGRVVPTSADVTNSEAVQIDGVFLYADLAGSAALAKNCPWSTTAKIIRAFLDVSSRLIRAYDGEIRSFDGDRVMGVFMGDQKNTYATRCAREIFYCVENIVGPKASKKFKSVTDAAIKLKCSVGVDRGTSRAVRAGIRANNDLIWIGRAPSMAAKLSDVREYPYCVFIHKDVYNKLPDSEKKEGETSIWETRTYKFAGEEHTVYRTNWTRTP
ncbi:MAG: adenylate cyclase [Methylobacteriaceae bacterium]|jgi:class 3 adenylate cyclase|nr:adenylate cyclase [Methylobacteriaceae bacterium]